MGLILDEGKSHKLWKYKAHTPRLLSLCSRDQEAQPLSTRAATTEACALQEKPPQREAGVLQLQKHTQQCQLAKRLPAMRETQVQSLGQEDPLEKGMASHSSILTQKIPEEIWL